MRTRDILIGLVVLAAGGAAAVAQTPVLGSIEAPYANLQTAVTLGTILRPGLGRLWSWGLGHSAFGIIGS